MMKMKWLFGLVLCWGAVASGAGGGLVIWDDGPAKKWDVAYPVGNGRVGAMPFGAFPEERVLVNEETIWQRKPGMVMPEDGFQRLEKVRELEAAGDYEGADRYFEKNIQGRQPPVQLPVGGVVGVEV